MAQNGRMDVELLHIDGCPSWVEAKRRLRRALDATRRSSTTIRVRRITTADEAASLPFAGSPTIMVNGADLFPGADPASELACRVYITETGLAGAPTETTLVAQLSQDIP